jgi:fructose-bisphosphate aldolase, class I
MNGDYLEKVRTAPGFFAALDQSGGSTPGALAEYGIGRDRYSSDAEMFDFVHALRARVFTSPAFDGDRIIASILFQQTMERDVDGLPTARYLWERKHVVPILKVDLGLADEKDGVQLMKPIDTLDDLLQRANQHRIFGTKMRSVIKDASETGISAIVEQQFGYADRIRAAGLVPILEPEVSIASPHKEQAEALLRDAIHKHVEALPADALIMVKLTIPTQPGLYADLASDPRVLRVLALSGGYSRDEACALLVHDHAMIASFSRALLEGLTDDQTDDQFNARLNASIAQIYQASVHKELPPHVCRGASSRVKPATKSSKDSGAAAGRTTNLLSPASANDAIRSRAPAQPSATSVDGMASGRRRRIEAASASGMPPNVIVRLIPK